MFSAFQGVAFHDALDRERSACEHMSPKAKQLPALFLPRATATPLTITLIAAPSTSSDSVHTLVAACFSLLSVVFDSGTDHGTNISAKKDAVHLK